ncbi:hypothetical protein [Prevotella pectinovora]
MEDSVCEATAVTVDVMETPSDTESKCTVATDDDLMLSLHRRDLPAG